MEVFVGLDWGEQHHQVHALDQGGGTRLSLRVPHDRSGLERLRVALAALGETADVGVAIERREGMLVDHLLAWGHPVYPVNPKVEARAREGYRAAPVKRDVLDAFALADLLRRQGSPGPLLIGAPGSSKRARRAIGTKDHADRCARCHPGPTSRRRGELWTERSTGDELTALIATAEHGPLHSLPEAGQSRDIVERPTEVLDVVRVPYLGGKTRAGADWRRAAGTSPCRS